MNEENKVVDDISASEATPKEKKLVAFVTSKTDIWREYSRTNYVDKWEEYERLWRGIFNESDKTRKSERSKIITPVLQQAIETYQSEIEEAVFGRGQYFDITNDAADANNVDVDQIKVQLKEDFAKNKVESAISDIITNAAVYGTGIGEIQIKFKSEKKPSTQQQGNQVLGGVSETNEFVVEVKPIHPKNFFIDPNVSSLDEALGCAIEEFVTAHSVIKLQESGAYRDVEIGPDGPDEELEPSQDLTYSQDDKIRVLRYYGLVPKSMLEGLGDENDKEEDDSLDKAIEETTTSEFEDYEEMVEAIVVIANGGALLKAVANPYMMQDRPIVYYQCDRLPGRFWGRGIAEKGYNMQKAIDAHVRSHIDGLALTSAPMMAMDSTRLPRGAKYEVKPGASLLTLGPPSDVLMPFTFGQSQDVNMAAAQNFERMLNQATGTTDAAGMPAQVQQGAQSGSLAIALSGIIKKNRRSLMLFQDNFLIPLVKKAAWRYMQFAPERYPVNDYKFVPVSTLGIVAREYEQQQYMGMMSTLGPDSKLVPLILKSIVGNSSLSDREQLKEALDKMSQPDPKQQQLAQQAQQLEMEDKMADVMMKKAKAMQAQADAMKTIEETKLLPDQLKIQMLVALTKNSETETEFGSRVKIAELALKEEDLNIKREDIASNERITTAQMAHQKEVASMTKSKGSSE